MNEKTKKIFWAMRLVCSAGAFLFALLQVLNVWNMANFAAIPLLSASLILQAVQEWKEHRGVAIFSIVATVVVLGCTAYMMTF